MSPATYVVLANTTRVSGYHQLDVDRTWPTALPARLFDGEWPGKVVARPSPSFKKKGPFLALRTLSNGGALVLHKKVVAKLPKEVREGERKMPFAPNAKTKPTDNEYVLLPVDRYVPLDRVASTFELAGKGEGDPLVAHAYTLTKLGFAHPEALPPIFRLLENPVIVIARKDIADLIVGLTMKEIIATESSPSTFPPSSAQMRPMKVPNAKEAHAAFWRLLGGSAKKTDRATALTHPTLACAVALAVDRAPKNDTRKAACADPFWATMYALHVDRAAREDTRQAAHASVDGAVSYADDVDLVSDDALIERMLTKKGWWDKPSAESWASSLREAHAQYRGAGAEPPKPATRDLPKVKAVPRYVEKGKGQLAPLSAEIRSDVESMTKHGHALLGLAADAPPSDVIDAVHMAVAEIQAGDRKIPPGKAGMQLRLGLACAIADALHRGLGWQWAAVGADGTAAVVSPKGTHAVVPLAPIARLAKKGVRENTIALMFNMIAAGTVPPKQDDAVVFIS